jgi:serine/threonine-protein kinase
MPASLPQQQPGPRPMLPGGAAAQAAQPAKRSNTLVYALAGVVVLALAGGGAWYAGLFGGHPAASVAESKPPTLTPANGQQGGQQAGQQGGQASSTTAPGGSTAASALPAKTDNPAEWLQAYQGGACFFAAVQPEAGSPVGIDVYATAEAAADKLAKDYEQVNGVAPQVRLRKLDRRQCAVADFLAGARAKGGNDLSLVLSKDDLKVGDVLSGTVGNTGARQVHLYLVTNEGVVYGLDELWKQRKTTGDTSVFGMKLFPTTDEPMPEPQPHLIVTVASAGTLDAAGITDPVLASELFPKIGTGFSAAGDAGAAVGYFMFGG